MALTAEQQQHSLAARWSRERPHSAVLRPAIGRAVRAGDREAERAARQDYYSQILAEKIEAIVAKAPPLRPEQIDSLRTLLGTAASSDTP